MADFIAVKALECEGDWFIVANDLAEEFSRLAEGEDDERFEEVFGHLRTGGDLNNVQLYTKDYG